MRLIKEKHMRKQTAPMNTKIKYVSQIRKQHEEWKKELTYQIGKYALIILVCFTLFYQTDIRNPVIAYNAPKPAITVLK